MDPDSGGSTDLGAMLAALSVTRRPGVFTMVSVAAYGDIPADLDAHALVREDEGWTIVCETHEAVRHGLRFSYEAAWLTVDVHSSLEAVGLTAALSTRLADAGLSCNVIAAAFHDHLLVAADDCDRAMVALAELRRSAGSATDQGSSGAATAS